MKNAKRFFLRCTTSKKCAVVSLKILFYRVFKKWPFFSQNLRNFRLNILCELLRIKCNKFCAFLHNFFLRKTGSFAQNVNFYAEHIFENWPKFTGSAQNQTTGGLFKNLHINKSWLCCFQLVTFSYKIVKLRDKNK